MSREGELRRQLESVEALSEAVTAMSSLSAHHLRQARAAVAPSHDYRDELAQALARAGVELPGAGQGETLLMVVGSQLGLCGGYNGRVAQVAAARRAELGDGPTLAVGRRLAGALERRGLRLSEKIPGVTSLDGVPPLVLTLAEHALLAHRRDGLRAVELVAARFLGVGDDRPQATPILPLELPPPSGPNWSLRYVSAEQMVDSAARELLYVTLLARLTDALAAEHGARLLATRSAGDWLDKRTTHLRRRLSAVRQEQSTQETLEVASASRQRRL